MEDNKKNKSSKLATSNDELAAYVSELYGRAALAATLGYQYGGERNMYDALGYKKELVNADYWVRYERQDIAKAIIDRPVDASWGGDIQIIETNDSETTPLEKEWVDISNRLKLKNTFIRLDKMTGLGRYSVLLMGLSDVKSNVDFEKPVEKSSKLQLLYVKPLSEKDAEIVKWVSDPSNPRFGAPEYYQLTLQDPTGTSSYTIRVHYSRVIHVIDEQVENEWLGIPRLKAVFNRLMDLEKLVGSSAEMFWRGAYPGMAGEIDKDFTMSTTEKDKLEDNILEWEHGLRRLFINKGVRLSTLQQSLSDPKSHVDIQIQMISAETHIPKRILTGSERGELSSGQDSDEWYGYIAGRRDEYCEPNIVRPFVDFCITHKILPEAKDGIYTIQWSNLTNVSDKEKVEVGKVRADALNAYASQPMAESVIPPDAFFEFFLGLNADQIELINTMKNNSMLDEQEQMKQIDNP